MTALLIAILGIASSVAAEAVTWINAKLSGTILAGKAAFLLSIASAFAVSIVKVLIQLHGNLAWSDIGTTWAQVWAVSQIYFILIAQWLGLEVKSE